MIADYTKSYEYKSTASGTIVASVGPHKWAAQQLADAIPTTCVVPMRISDMKLAPKTFAQTSFPNRAQSPLLLPETMTIQDEPNNNNNMRVETFIPFQFIACCGNRNGFLM